jgi:UDP-N-acetylmuramate dehydrogenase
MPAKPKLRGRCHFAEPLAPYTTWRVGGVADRLYQPADVADLGFFLSQLSTDEPLFWLGLGSNLLVRDRGIRGTVIATHGALQELSLIDPQTLRVEVGVPCAKVARFSAYHNLCGIEFLAGIPGVMGGALAMNAGAWGGELWSYVTVVETIDRYGEIRKRQVGEYEIGYRSVKGPDEEWFIAAYLRLKPGDGKAALKYMRELLVRRSQTQPTGVPSCGSVFRNPPGDFAARLIEAAGLKGMRLGAALVSPKHANFIINTGNAKAAELEGLIRRVIETVERVHSVQLLPEVRFVGEHGKC